MNRLACLFLLLACFGVGLFATNFVHHGDRHRSDRSRHSRRDHHLHNLDTGAERNTVADDQGRYNIQQLPPGSYKVTAKATGFADFVVDRLELLVNQPATLEVKFEKVGSTSTTVEVAAAATQVNTTDASLGNAIDKNVIINMPSFARNVVGLLAFQPGVTSYSSGGTVGSNDGAVNGGKPDQGNVTLDGADVNDQNARAAFTSVLRVTLDSVEEFRTTTTNGDSATGRGSGADVTLVTKSGTNTFHGSAYEYRRGTETAANTFFNNQKPAWPIAPLLVNVYGGSLGGRHQEEQAVLLRQLRGAARRQRHQRESNRSYRDPEAGDCRLSEQIRSGRNSQRRAGANHRSRRHRGQCGSSQGVVA